MKHTREIRDNEIHVWTFSIDDQKLLSAKDTVLSADEKERSARFVFDRDRERFCIGRIKLRRLLAEYTGLSAAEIIFRYNTFGKPSIERDITFNISHSEDIMVAAVAKCREVGIDVEKIRELNDLDDMAQVAFTDNEREFLRCQPHEMKTECFLRFWTIKEAILKAAGVGLLDERGIPDGLSVEVSKKKSTAVSFYGKNWGLRAVDISDNPYVGTVCFDIKNNNCSVNYSNRKLLLSKQSFQFDELTPAILHFIQ